MINEHPLQNLLNFGKVVLINSRGQVQFEMKCNCRNLRVGLFKMVQVLQPLTQLNEIGIFCVDLYMPEAYKIFLKNL